MLTRRKLGLSAAAVAITACTQPNNNAQASEGSKAMTTNTDINWSALSESEWRDRLTDLEFSILRKEGTERPFTSPLNDNKAEGTYVCAGCQLPLFTSDMKFDSGTGWPSFFTVIQENIGTKVDKKLFMSRTEYHCKRCGGHQGHVFKDGPAPTGLRYCNNGVALDFVEGDV